MKESKSNINLAQEMTIAEAIDSESNESLITEIETICEGELSDWLNQLQELGSESEIAKEDLDLIQKSLNSIAILGRSHRAKRDDLSY